MDALEICNKLRSEASGVATSGIPLDIFPQKMQQMILDLEGRKTIPLSSLSLP